MLQPVCMDIEYTTTTIFLLNVTAIMNGPIIYYDYYIIAKCYDHQSIFRLFISLLYYFGFDFCCFCVYLLLCYNFRMALFTFDNKLLSATKIPALISHCFSLNTTCILPKLQQTIRLHSLDLCILSVSPFSQNRLCCVSNAHHKCSHMVLKMYIVKPQYQISTTKHDKT